MEDAIRYPLYILGYIDHLKAKANFREKVGFLCILNYLWVS